MALLLLPAALIANFLTLEEAGILSFAVNLCYLWCFLLLFFGTLTIHGYSLGRNILSTVLSLAAMLIITFLAILLIALLQKMGSFSGNLIDEILYRL